MSSNNILVHKLDKFYSNFLKELCFPTTILSLGGDENSELAERKNRLLKSLKVIEEKILSEINSPFIPLISPTDQILNYLDSNILPQLNDIIELVLSLNSIPRQKWKEGSPPPAPPCLISVKHQSFIHTSIEILFQWGIQLYLNNGLGFEIPDSTMPKTILINKSDITCILNDIEKADEVRIFNYLKCLYSVVTNDIFSPMMLQRNMKRIILTLLTLTTNISYNNNFIIESSKQLLSEVISVNNRKAMIISELRWATRGIPEIKKSSTDLFLTILLSDQGLLSVLQGYLPGVTDGPKSTPLQVQVARLITSIPKTMDKEVYFKALSPQILDLITFGYNNKDMVVMKVCVLIISRISIISLNNASIILQQIASPLLCLINHSNSIIKESSNNILETSSIISSEIDIEVSVQILFSILNLCPSIPSLLKAISSSGTFVAMLTLFIEGKINCKISKLITIIEEFCILYLTNIDPIIATHELEKVIFDFYYCYNRDNLSKKYHVSPGSNGGIEIRKNTVNVNKFTSLLNDISDLSNNKNMDKIEKMNNFIEARSKIVAELLVHLELQFAKSNNNNSNSNSGSLEKDIVDEDADNSVRKIATNLFLISLKTYLDPKTPLNNNLDSDSLLNNAESKVTELSDSNDRKNSYGILLLVLLDIISIDSLLYNGVQIISMIVLFIETFANECSKNEDNFSNQGSINSIDENIANKIESLKIILNILNGILGLGNSKRTEEEENLLKNLLEPLRVISYYEIDNELSQLTADSALMILTRGLDEIKIIKLKIEDEFQIVVNDNSEYLISSNPSLRAYGIKNIIVSLREIKNDINSNDLNLAIEVLFSVLNDPDSFVYLSMVHVIVELVENNREIVLPILISAFNGEYNFNNISDKNNFISKKDINSDYRRRSLIGEVLAIILRNDINGAHYLVPLIVSSCIRVIRKIKKPSKEEEELIENHVNLLSMRLHSLNLDKDDDININGDGIFDKNIDNNNKKLSAHEIDHMSIVSDSILLRQSAIALLSDSVGILGWSAQKYLTDVIEIAVDILKVEYKRLQTNRIMRRSASFLLRSLLIGLDDRIFLIDNGSHLSNIYSSLKMFAHDKDEVVKHHIEVGISFIDKMVRSQLNVPS